MFRPPPFVLASLISSHPMLPRPLRIVFRALQQRLIRVSQSSGACHLKERGRSLLLPPKTTEREIEMEMEMAERLKECIQELVKFALHSHINQTLGFDLGLSSDFCSNLLEPDPTDAVSLPPPAPAAIAATDSFQGVPPYPLYKRLAWALYQSIVAGELAGRKCNEMQPFINQEDVSSNQRKHDWDELIRERGSQLLNILKATSCELNVQEPFFSHFKDGLKTVEGRCARGKFNRIEPGSLILLNGTVMLEVEAVRQYASFVKMFEAESLQKVLPGVETIEEGVKIYRKFYTEDEEMSNGVLAICASKLTAQPYLILSSIIFGLSYYGIQSLLGLGYTSGTVYDAVPPPRSVLLSSFSLPYSPNIKGSSLTNGARALAKHAERCRDKYWGTINGNDSAKNRHATDVINCLIASSCWSNVHIVPQHGVVFEIRVADGYGARWSKDGSKFIGFLEPYTEGGHNNGWKH